AGVARIGDVVWDFLMGLIDLSNVSGVLNGYVTQGSITSPGGYVVDGAVYVAQVLIGMAQPLLNPIRDALNCVRQWVRTMFSRCDVGSLLGLLQVRTVIRCLRETEVGTDAALWA